MRSLGARPTSRSITSGRCLARPASSISLLSWVPCKRWITQVRWWSSPSAPGWANSARTKPCKKQRSRLIKSGRSPGYRKRSGVVDKLRYMLELVFFKPGFSTLVACQPFALLEVIQVVAVGHVIGHAVIYQRDETSKSYHRRQPGDLCIDRRLTLDEGALIH